LNQLRIQVSRVRDQRLLYFLRRR